MLPFIAICLFFFNDTATTEIYTLSLHDALPIRPPRAAGTHDMVRVSLEDRPLTATASLVWSGDLPRMLQQILFDTADGVASPAPAPYAGLAPLGPVASVSTLPVPAASSLPGGFLYQPPVQLGREPMDLPGQLRVGFELQFLLGEIVIRLGLLECRLPVLADHDERGQEDRFQRHDQRQRRPRTLLDEQHPESEQRHMQVDEIHRPGETGDQIGDPQLKARGASRLFLQDDWVVQEFNRQLKLGHPGASISAQAASLSMTECRVRRPPPRIRPQA